MVSLCSVAATLCFKMFPDGRVAVPTYVSTEVSGSEQVFRVFILRKKKKKKTRVFLLFLIFSYLVKVDVHLLYKTPNKQTCLSVCLQLRQINTTS